MATIDHELARDRAAVADSDPSPTFASVDASGRVALALARGGAAPALPFRVTWLALHAQGSLPSDADRAHPVWDAFCDLPPGAQTALWHHEVEGEEPTTIALATGTTADVVRDDLALAYAAVRARVDRVPPLGSRDAGAQLLLLEHSLRDSLAGVVLGPAAGRYLAARTRAGQHRVILTPVPRRQRRAAPFVAALTAAAVTVAAAVLLGQSTPRSPGELPSFQAVAEPPVVGVRLEPQPVGSVEPTTASRTRVRPAAVAPVAAPTSSTPAAPAAGPSGGGSAEPQASQPPPAPQPQPQPQPEPQPEPQPAPQPQPQPQPEPAADGPGQGLEHASEQGASNGVRAHGNPSKGPGKAGDDGKGKGSGKGKGAGRR